MNWEKIDGVLPAGIALDASTGLLSGTPTEVGNFAVVVKATDGSGNSGTKGYQFSIATTLPLIISPETIPNGRLGEAYSIQLSAALE